MQEHALAVRHRRGKQEVVAFDLADLGALVRLADQLGFPGWRHLAETAGR